MTVSEKIKLRAQIDFKYKQVVTNAFNQRIRALWALEVVWSLINNPEDPYDFDECPTDKTVDDLEGTFGINNEVAPKTIADQTSS